MTQQGDVLLAQTTNDGDLESVEGVVTMTCGFETAVYLSMFNGADWWGDLQETDPAMMYPSETGAILESSPAVPANLGRIEQAALRDLAWLISQEIASRVEVSATMPGVDRVEIQIIIEAEGERSQFNFVENWECSNTGGLFEGAGAAEVPVTPPGHTNPAVWAEVAGYPGSAPVSVAVASSTGHVYVVDTTTISVYRYANGVGPWAVVGNLSAVSVSPGRIAVDAQNGDVFVTDLSQDVVYKLTSGVGSFSPIGNYPTGSNDPLGLSVNPITKDVYVSDTVQDAVYKLTSGVGNFAVDSVLPLPGAGSVEDVSVNEQNLDVWTVSGFGTGDVRRQAGGTGTHVVTGAFPGTDPAAIDVDSSNGRVYVIDLITQEIYTLDEGASNFVQFGDKAWTASVSLAENSTNGDVWVADLVGGTLYHSPGVAV